MSDPSRWAKTWHAVEGAATASGEDIAKGDEAATEAHAKAAVVQGVESIPLIGSPVAIGSGDWNPR